MVLVALLGGCNNGPASPTPTTHAVAAHGDTLQKAHQRALRKAQVQCKGDQTRVVERQPHPKEPTFASQPLPDAPPPDASAELAATTHEGESPAMRLGFQCISDP